MPASLHHMRHMTSSQVVDPPTMGSLRAVVAQNTPLVRQQSHAGRKSLAIARPHAHFRRI